MSIDRNKQQGFTLIELMIVVAIIAILAAIAIPAFINYANRARSSELVNIASGLKTPVAMCLLTNSATPADCDSGSNGVPDVSTTVGTYTASVDIVDGVITVTGNATQGGETYILSPTVSGGVVSWDPSGTCVTSGNCPAAN